MTKDQVEQYVAQNKVELKEVRKGEAMEINKSSRFYDPYFERLIAGERSADSARIVLANDYDAYQRAMKIPELRKAQNEGGNWTRILADSLIEETGGEARHRGHVMEGESSNYREVLLTLPNRRRSGLEELRGRSFSKRQEIDDAVREGRSADEVRRIVEEYSALSKQVEEYGPVDPGFRVSGHWSEPDVLAWGRAFSIGLQRLHSSAIKAWKIPWL